MELRSDSDGFLITGKVPVLIPEQVKQFTQTALGARTTRELDPHLTHNALVRGTASGILAIDIGGDKLISAPYEIREGELGPKQAPVVLQSEGGRGYVEHLEKLAGDARRDRLRVGISFAGPTEGTRLMGAPNLPALFDDLLDRYDLDLANLFPSVALANDAEAGIMAASIEAIKRDRTTQHIIYIINGSGLGGAVLTRSRIVACEPGHIEANPRLNPFNTTKQCGLLGRTHVCLEGIAASKAGIEDTWLRERGESRSGRQIARLLWNDNDLFARNLYDNSALVTVHAIAGLANAFQIPFDQTYIVAHGGIFEVPSYRERVRLILKEAGISPLGSLFTRDFSANACLDGAAVAAVLKDLCWHESHPDPAHVSYAASWTNLIG